MTEAHRCSRRALLAGVTAAASGAAVSGAAAQEGEQLIEMTDDLVFDPDSITVSPGTTVVWETVEPVPHTVTAYEEEIPEDAEYFASGGFDDEAAARGSSDAGLVQEGETYSHTFEVEGTYEYFCIPHEAAGMLGTIEVGAGGGEGASRPSLPNRALTLGVAVSAALVAVLGLGYFFLKYGGDYRE